MNNLKTSNIKAIINTSFLDWPGNICTVLFLGGCNFRCPYCHNKDLVMWPQKIKDIPFDEVQKIIMENPGWIDGVVITGGEPTLDAQLIPLITAIREMDLLVKLDTNGSNPDILESIIKKKLVNYIAMDLKAPLKEDAYSRCIGVTPPPLSKIKQSVQLLLQNNVDYEFRVTICPTLLGEQDILSMAHNIKGARRFTLQNFKANNTLDSTFENLASYSKTELENFKRLIMPYIQECSVISPNTTQ